MSFLDRRLRSDGFSTASFGYFPPFESYHRIVIRLRGRMNQIARSGPYGVVAHSMGGVLVRAALGSTDTLPPKHVVMLGTPNKRSRMAEWAARYTPWGLLVGEAGRKLADPHFFSSLPIPQIPCTIVAGTKSSPIGSGPFGDEANDSLVAVSETVLEAGERHVTFPVGHTFMMNNALVTSVILDTMRRAASG